MRRPFTSIIRASCVLTLLIACARDNTRTNIADSLAASRTDTQKVTDAYASDGNLTVRVSVMQQELLRAVADSFGTREAIRVVFVPLSDSLARQSFAREGEADIIVVSADAIDRTFPDSLPWLLPFAAMLPDSASLAMNRADSLSANQRSSAVASRRARTARGRRADSIRADSMRRETARLTEERARADSARLLLLTIPEASKNRAMAERFVRYLLTDGRAPLLQAGARVLSRLIVHGRGVPPGMLPMLDSVATDDILSVSIPPQLLNQ